MALVTLPGLMYYPKYPATASGTPTLNAIGLSAAGDTYGVLCEAPKTGDITKIHYHLRTVNGSGTGTIRASIQTVTHSGVPSSPSGTLWGTNTSGTKTVDPATDDNTVFATTLTSAAAVTRGDKLAVCIDIETLGSLTLVQLAAFGDEQGSNYPYLLLFAAATWTLQTAGGVIALEYDDGTIVCPPGITWFSANNTITVSSSTTPDTISQRINVGVPMSVSGGWVWGDLDGAMTVRLVTEDYNQGAGTGILATTTIANDDRGSNGADIHHFLFPSDVELSVGVNYRLVFEATSGTSGSLYDISVGSSAQTGTKDGGGNFHLSTAKDPTGNGSWTNYNNGTDGYRSLWAGLLVGGLSAGIFLSAWGLQNPAANQIAKPAIRAVAYG